MKSRETDSFCCSPFILELFLSSVVLQRLSAHEKKYPKYGNLREWLPCLNQRNQQMSQAATKQLAYFVFLLSFTNA